jgi:hypothetical protein
MIFFLQVKHGLPSLHQLLRRQPAPLPRRTVYALDFAEGGDAGRVREEDVGDITWDRLADDYSDLIGG